MQPTSFVHVHGSVHKMNMHAFILPLLTSLAVEWRLVWGPVLVQGGGENLLCVDVFLLGVFIKKKTKKTSAVRTLLFLLFLYFNGIQFVLANST